MLFPWIALIAVITVLLTVDLLVVHRGDHEVTFRSAAIESAVWIAIGLSFGVVMLVWRGGTAAAEYLSGYLIEQSLSIDNVFVWAVLLTTFAVPRQQQFRVLFWGIFGAIVLRAAFIFAGVALIERFDWILYGFGAFLVYTAITIARHDESEAADPEQRRLVRIVRRFIRSPFLAVLVMIELTDVVFAFDSVPAILAVSRDEYIVFASNAFAILGLRSLYFCLAGMADRFRYLNVGLGIILAFVGTKMLLTDFVHVPTVVSLLVIIGVLVGSVLASVGIGSTGVAPRGTEHGAEPARPEAR
ncbi:MAG: tellurite resistance protein TerC [Actinomycetota bacterium]